MHCPQCDLGHLPCCAGRDDPTLCAPDRRDERHARSLAKASIEFGWPARKRPTRPAERFPRRIPRRDGGPIRVLFWGPAFYCGGVERWQIDLIRRFNPARVATVGVAIQEPEATDPRMVAEVAALAPVGHGTAAALAGAREADVVVTWGPLPRAELAGPDPRSLVVTVSHGDGRCPYTARWMAGSIPGTDHFAACASTGLATVPEPYRAAATVLHNGADPGRLTPRRTRAEARAAWGVPGNAKVLGYLGRFAIEDKRADLVARVAAHLPEDWRVVLVGDGHARAEVAAIAARTPRTVLAPWVDRSGDALVGFDLLANPSAVEGFGLSMVEAMLAGVPVVGTATGIAAELPGLLSGRIATDATADQLAAEVVRVAADPATADVVEHARAVALDRFTAAAFAGRWAGYLERIVRRARKPRGSLAETIARQAAGRAAARAGGCRTC